MSNFKERHPPMGSEKDSSSSSEDELSLRVKALLAECDDEQTPKFSAHKESQVRPSSVEAGAAAHVSCSLVNPDCHHSADEVIFPIKEKEHVAESPTTLKDSPSSTSYNVHESLSCSYSSEVFREGKIAKSSSIIKSHVNLENEPKLNIFPDLSVRPKTHLKSDKESESILPKDSATHAIYSDDLEPEFAKRDFTESMYKNRDSEMSKKRVSFASRNEVYEGNMKILGFMKSDVDATPLRNLEHHTCQPISDLPEEYQKHILSAPIFIDSEMLDTDEYSCRLSAENPISSSDVLPHIRWYPIPSCKSSQDIKNAATQTSLCQSKEAGTSSEVDIEVGTNFAKSSEADQYLHMTATVDLSSPVSVSSHLPEWQAHADMRTSVDISSPTSVSSHSPEFQAHADMRTSVDINRPVSVSSHSPEWPDELYQFKASEMRQRQLKQSVIESVGVIRSLDTKKIKTSHLSPQEIIHYKNEGDSIKRIQHEVHVSDDEGTSAAEYQHDDKDDESLISGTFISSEKDKQEFTFDSSKKVSKDASIQVTVIVNSKVFKDVSTQVTTIDSSKVFKDASTQVENSKDASTQVENCDCVNEFKNMFIKALNKVPNEQVCPFHKALKKRFHNTRPTGIGTRHTGIDRRHTASPQSETFDVVFVGDKAHEIHNTESSPLYFNSILMSPLRYVRKRKAVKKLPEKEKPSKKEVRYQEEKKQLLRSMFRKQAKRFSKQLAKNAAGGKINYTRYERIVKKSPYYV